MAEFFGQYLLERGAINREQLLDAVKFQKTVNRALGDMALERGLLTAAQVEEIHTEQRRRDRYFGEIAVEKRYLTEEQVEDLLGVQRASHLYLGSALVARGHLSEARIDEMLLEFQAARGEAEPMQAQLRKLGVERIGAVGVFVEHAGKLLRRLARIDVKVGKGRRGGSFPGKGPVPTIEIFGDLSWVVCMRFETRGPGGLCAQLASGMAGVELVDPELLMDAAAEFLNILSGHAIASLRNAGTRLEMHPPEVRREGPFGDRLLVVPLIAPDDRLYLGIHGQDAL